MRTIVSIVLMAWLGSASASPMQGPCDSWQEVLVRKKGTVTALWDGIEPFIYQNKEGTLCGVEYEIMESLRSWVRSTYAVELEVHWEKAGSFGAIYDKVRNSKGGGAFGWSYYSITPERQQQVQFTLPYMPDVNVLVTNNREPMYANAQEFINGIKGMTAYSQRGTTMDEDIAQLCHNFFPKLPVRYLQQDYEILRTIATDERGFAYVPLSVYIVALQKGIRVKRQNILASRRQGFAAVMPLHSDWKPLLDEYFSSNVFRAKANTIINKYLGSEVTDLVFDSGQALPNSAATIDLVSLEKEIVTRRLMDAVQLAERHRALRNILGVLLGSGVLLFAVLYSRFRTKQKLTAQLTAQKEQIAEMNQLLKLKILQARMNPHFLFNSLNSIQYFITGGDQKASLLYIGRFSAFLRKVINLGDELFISVADEAALLKEYLWLEHCRFNDKFEYEISVSPETQQARILPLLTHSLVETALYNGVLNLKNGQKGQVCVEFTIQSAALQVQVSDNGRRLEGGADHRVLRRDESMLQKRIELFNAQSGQPIITSVREEEKSTIVTLTIPQPLFKHEIQSLYC